MDSSLICYTIFIFFDLLFIFYRLFVLIIYIDFVSSALQILFYIIFIFMTLFYLFMIIINIPIRIGCIESINQNLKDNKTKKTVLGIIVFAFGIFQLVVLSFFLGYVDYYQVNCPFILTDDFSEHYKKRCQLYNKNMNSRYSNQYICTYDPTNDFKYKYVRSGRSRYKKEKKIREKIEDDFLVCVDFSKEIEDNPIVTSFCREYIDSKKYYCSRTNQPKRYNKVSDESCKSKTKYYVGMIIIIVISYLEIIYAILAVFIHYYDLPYYEFRHKKKKTNYNNKINNNNNTSVNINNNLNYIFGGDQKKNDAGFEKKEEKGVDKNGEFTKSEKKIDKESQFNSNNTSNISSQ